MSSNIYEIDRDISKIVRLINLRKFNGKNAQEQHDEHTQKAYEAMAMDDRFVAENHCQQAEYYRRIMNHPNHCVAGTTEEPLHPTITRLEQVIASTAIYMAKRKEEIKAAKAEKAAKKEAAEKAKADRMKEEKQEAEGNDNKAEIRESDGNLAENSGEPCKIIPFTRIVPRSHFEENSPD